MKISLLEIQDSGNEKAEHATSILELFGTEEVIERINQSETVEELYDWYHHFEFFFSNNTILLKECIEDDLRDLKGNFFNPKLKESFKTSSPDTYFTEVKKIANMFGLTPEKYGENLKENYQKHDVDQWPVELEKVVATLLKNSDEKHVELFLSGVRDTVSNRLAIDPEVKQCVRKLYMHYSCITVNLLSKGNIYLIDLIVPNNKRFI